MPRYEYECETCQHRFEVQQKFSDPLVEQCERCGKGVRKLISAPGLMFKGTGWYVTDYSNKLKDPNAKDSGGKDGGGDAKDGGGKDKDTGGTPAPSTSESGATTPSPTTSPSTSSSTPSPTSDRSSTAGSTTKTPPRTSGKT